MKDKLVLLSEKNGAFGKEVIYCKPPDQKTVAIVSHNLSIKDGFGAALKEIFLPQGYPSSVSEDYIKYQIWDTVQAFCSTITGILATQSVMKGIGVGDSDATPLAATVTWVLKDGTGHIGRIGFAWWKGTSLDANSKYWRLVADVLNDLAICIELALPIFKGYAVYILCVTTVMKAIVGVAGGATRAALTQHQAIRGNLADVAAKDGSQETAVNLIASLVALLLLSLSEMIVWPLFFMFTFLHLLSNYYAVTSVCLKTFNRSRFFQVIVSNLNAKTFEPTIINKLENVFTNEAFIESTECGYNIQLGHSLKNIVSKKHIGLDDFQNSIDIFNDRNYLLLIDMREKYVHVVFNESVTSKEVLQSYFHAFMLGMALSKNKDKFNVMRNEKAFMEKEWESFSQKLIEAGWIMKNNLLTMQEWRASW